MLRGISHQLWTTEYFSIPLLTLTEVKWNDLFPRLPFPPQDTALSRRRSRVRIPHTLPRYGKCKAPALAIPIMLIVTAVGADITSGSQKRPFANRIFGFWTTGSSANVSPGPE